MLGLLCWSILTLYGWCLGLYRKGLCPFVGYGIPLCACFMRLFAMCSASQIFRHSIFLWLSPLVKAMWNLRFLSFLLYQMSPLLFPCFCCSLIASQKYIYTLFSFFLFFKVSFIYIISSLCLRVLIGIIDL